MMLASALVETWAVLLGQPGFLDRFTVTLAAERSRSIQPPEVFGERFAEQIRAVEQRQMTGTIDGLGWSDG